MRNICTVTRNFTTSTWLVPKECSANRQIAPVGGALLSIQFARSSRRVGQLFVGAGAWGSCSSARCIVGHCYFALSFFSQRANVLFSGSWQMTK